MDEHLEFLTEQWKHFREREQDLTILFWNPKSSNKKTLMLMIKEVRKRIKILEREIERYLNA